MMYIYFVSEIQLIHTNSAHAAFQRLSSELERELFLRDGELAGVNHELNRIDFLEAVVLALVNDAAVACGGFRKYNNESIELKRMYVVPSFRRRNLASRILVELEAMASSKGYHSCILETGMNQPEAIMFYRKHGYSQTEKFGIYRKSSNSVCFSKTI